MGGLLEFVVFRPGRDVPHGGDQRRGRSQLREPRLTAVHVDGQFVGRQLKQRQPLHHLDHDHAVGHHLPDVHGGEGVPSHASAAVRGWGERLGWGHVVEQPRRFSISALGQGRGQHEPQGVVHRGLVGAHGPLVLLAPRQDIPRPEAVGRAQETTGRPGGVSLQVGHLALRPSGHDRATPSLAHAQQRGGVVPGRVDHRPRGVQQVNLKLGHKGGRRAGPAVQQLRAVH